jgi:hypothetical protein
MVSPFLQFPDMELSWGRIREGSAILIDPQIALSSIERQIDQ